MIPPPTRNAAIAAGGVALLVRLAAIVQFPVMPAGDGYTRLGRLGEGVVHGWLPGYQLTLNALGAFTRDPTAFRVLTAVEGAAGAAAVALLAGVGGGPAAAAAAGLFVAFGPVHVFPA